MPLWSAELPNPYSIDNIHALVDMTELERVFATQAALTPVEQGGEIDITPELMRRERRHQLTGYTYLAQANEDEEQTGTIRMLEMSPLSKGLIIGDEGKLYRARGPYEFSLGPQGLRRLYIAHYTLQRQTVIPSAVVWKPSK